VSVEDLVRVTLVGGPLDGETRAVRRTSRVRSFTVDLGARGPIGFPLVTMETYERGEDGVWRWVAPPFPIERAEAA
jgi:hypothetical protein